MKKYFISILSLFFITTTFTAQVAESVIPQEYIDKIDAEVQKRLDKVSTEVSSDPNYMTQKQLDEYRQDLNRYAEAIKDAIHATPEEMSKKLQQIAPWNKNILNSSEKTHILVVSWMSKWAYENFYLPDQEKNKGRYRTKNIKTRKSGTKDVYEYLSWVTIPGETQKFILTFKRTNPTTKQLQKRLTQYFGLPPEEPGHYAEKVFVELWVKPEDLIRPCINSNLLNNSCAADLFPKTSPAPFDNLFNLSTHDQAYIDWYKKERSEKYTSQFMPWTRLGYLFDWGADFIKHAQKSPEIGGTEFIIRPGSEIIIERAVPTEKYIRQESEL